MITLLYIFLNLLKFSLEWKTKQLNGPGIYRELRETGPWPGYHVIAKLIFMAFNKRAEISAIANIDALPGAPQD